MAALYAAPAIVSATDNTITIRAGIRSNPGELAAAHCAKSNRNATLRRTEALEISVSGTNSQIYYFDCI